MSEKPQPTRNIPRPIGLRISKGPDVAGLDPAALPSVARMTVAMENDVPAARPLAVIAVASAARVVRSAVQVVMTVGSPN